MSDCENVVPMFALDAATGWDDIGLNGGLRSRRFSRTHMKQVSLPPLTDNLACKIIGIWTLKSREDVDAEGQIVIDPFLGPDPIGLLCFGPGHFSAQFMKRDRSEQESLSERVQAKNNTAALNGYDAYFGTYTVDEAAGTIATRLEGSISPINMGKTFIREARVVGDELTIQLKTTSVGGRAITRTNTFSRVG